MASDWRAELQSISTAVSPIVQDLAVRFRELLATSLTIVITWFLRLCVFLGYQVTTFMVERRTLVRSWCRPLNDGQSALLD